MLESYSSERIKYIVCLGLMSCARMIEIKKEMKLSCDSFITAAELRYSTQYSILLSTVYYSVQYTTQYSILLSTVYYSVLYTTLYCILLCTVYYSVLYTTQYSILLSTVYYCVLYCCVLYCCVLYCCVLYCCVLYYCIVYATVLLLTPSLLLLAAYFQLRVLQNELNVEEVINERTNKVRCTMSLTLSHRVEQIFLCIGNLCSWAVNQ